MTQYGCPEEQSPEPSPKAAFSEGCRESVQASGKLRARRNLLVLVDARRGCGMPVIQEHQLRTRLQPQAHTRV